LSNLAAMSDIALSVHAIAALKLVSVQAVRKAMAAGAFGQPLRHGNRRYAAKAAVEAHIGQPITQEQIARATGGRRNCMLIVESTTED
jgi:hypothetical protein